MRIFILLAVLALATCLGLAALVAHLDGRGGGLSLLDTLILFGVIAIIAVAIAYVVLPTTIKGQSALIGGDFIRTDPAPQGYVPQAKFDDILRVILNVSRGRIIGTTVVARTMSVRIRYVRTPALVVRAILDRAPENVEWRRSWLPFARLSRDRVRQMLEQAETPDVYALLPPGQSYSRADQMFSRDGPQAPLPGRRGRHGSEMGWPLDIKSPVLPTPAGRYVNIMLLRMFEDGETLRVLKRLESLLPITLGAETVTAPPLDDVLAHLRKKCHIAPGSSAGPTEGTLDLAIRETPCKLWCRFDDDTEVCCEIRLAAMDIPQNQNRDSGNRMVASGNDPNVQDKRARRRRGPMVFIMPAALILVALLAVLPLQMCRDWAFVCENTGSHQGYRQWFTGHRTGQWYQESHLEQFMDQAHPGVLKHQWVSYRGTGRNLLGRPIRLGLGHPNPVLMARRHAFDFYVDSLDDAGKLNLYQTLAFGAPGEVEVQMGKVRDYWLANVAFASSPE